MAIDDVLSRVDAVKRTGESRWIGRCPAHPDRRPSLAIREVPDGRVLIHCFAECSTEAVLSALGVEFDALFPTRLSEINHCERRPFNPMDVLRCLGNEALIIAVAAGNIRQGVPLTQQDHARLLLAAGRIQSAVELCNG